MPGRRHAERKTRLTSGTRFRLVCLQRLQKSVDQTLRGADKLLWSRKTALLNVVDEGSEAGYALGLHLFLQLVKITVLFGVPRVRWWVVAENVFGEQELEGIAARGNIEITQHQNASGKYMEYFDEGSKEKYVPTVS